MLKRLGPSCHLLQSPARWPLLAASLALALLLAGGCAGKKAATDRVALRVSTNDSGVALAPYRTLIEGFQKVEPRLEVRLEAISGGDYYTRVLTQYASGDAVDVIQIGDDALPRFVGRDAMQPLDGFMTGDLPLRQEDYVPGVLEPGSWGGHQFLLPKDYTPMAILCNAALFRRAGVPLPREGWTWEEFRQTARALTRDQDGDGKTDLWGVVLPGPVSAQLELWTSGAGGSLVREDGSYQGALDSPEALRALRFVRALQDEDRSAPLPQELGNWESGNRHFEQGKAAMWLTGRWPMPALEEQMGKDLVVVLPPRDKAPSNVLFWSGFGISSQCRHPREAWKFLRHLAGPESARVWKAWGLPTSVQVVREDGMEANPLEGPWIRAVQQCRPRSYTRDPLWYRFGDQAARALMEIAVLLPEQDLEEAAHRLAREADEERRRALERGDK